MAMSIRKQPLAPSPKAKAVKDKGYLAWLHNLPCAATGVDYDIQAAHLSTAAPEYGSYGRGKSSKISDLFCLPLSREQHSIQHSIQHSMNEMEYWNSVGVNPHLLALVLFGIYTQFGDEGVPYAREIILKGVKT